MAPRALLGGPNFLAGLHLLSSLLRGAASTAWRWAIDRLLPLRELESSVALAAGRCSWAPGRGSVACAHGELGRDVRGGEPRPRHLCSEAVAAPRRTRSKTRIGFLKLRITLGPMIASWRRTRRLFWTHPIIFLGRPKLLFSRHWLLNFTAVQIDYVGAAVRRGTIVERCGRALTERGGDRPTTAAERKSLQPKGAP